MSLTLLPIESFFFSIAIILVCYLVLKKMCETPCGGILLIFLFVINYNKNSFNKNITNLIN